MTTSPAPLPPRTDNGLYLSYALCSESAPVYEIHQRKRATQHERIIHVAGDLLPRNSSHPSPLRSRETNPGRALPFVEALPQHAPDAADFATRSPSWPPSLSSTDLLWTDPGPSDVARRRD